MMDHYGDCPECGSTWGYGEEGDDNTRYTHLTGRIENDRIQEWMCPFCGAGWSRWTGELIDKGVSP